MTIDDVIRELKTQGMSGEHEVDVRFFFNERAGIREFEAGQSRMAAELSAAEEAMRYGMGLMKPQGNQADFGFSEARV